MRESSEEINPYQASQIAPGVSLSSGKRFALLAMVFMVGVGGLSAFIAAALFTSIAMMRYDYVDAYLTRDEQALACLAMGTVAGGIVVCEGVRRILRLLKCWRQRPE